MAGGEGGKVWSAAPDASGGEAGAAGIPFPLAMYSALCSSGGTTCIKIM